MIRGIIAHIDAMKPNGYVPRLAKRAMEGVGPVGRNRRRGWRRDPGRRGVKLRVDRRSNGC